MDINNRDSGFTKIRSMYYELANSRTQDGKWCTMLEALFSLPRIEFDLACDFIEEHANDDLTDYVRTVPYWIYDKIVADFMDYNKATSNVKFKTYLPSHYITRTLLLTRNFEAFSSALPGKYIKLILYTLINIVKVPLSYIMVSGSREIIEILCDDKKFNSDDLKTLRALHCESCYLDDALVFSLSKCVAFSHIESLIIRENPYSGEVTDLGTEYIAKSSVFSNLRHLHIGSLYISIKSYGIILNSIKLEHLEEVGFSFPKPQVDIKELSTYSNCLRNLKKIVFFGTTRENYIEEFCKILQLPLLDGIPEINLREAWLNDTFATRLLDCKYVENIKLLDCRGHFVYTNPIILSPMVQKDLRNQFDDRLIM